MKWPSLIAAAGIVIATPAYAGGHPKVFPLTASGLPRALASAPEKMTNALAESLDAEIVSSPIEDAAGLLGCDVEASSCLESVASSRSVAATQLVFGSVAYEDDRVKVTLTRFDPGPYRQQQTFDLSETSSDALADELVRAAAPLLGIKRAKHRPKVVKPVSEVTRPTGPDEDIVDAPPTHNGTITSGTWAMIGGGGVAAAVGLGFLASASGLRDQVNNAPHATPEDFARLRPLERAGTQRTQIGDVLTVAGVVVLGVGVIRAVLQHQPVSDTATVHVQSVPVEGGAALVLSWGMP